MNTFHKGIIFFLWAVLALFSEEIRFSKEKTKISAQSITANEVIIDVTIGAAEVLRSQYEGFQEMSINDFTNLGIIGAPSVPVKDYTFIVNKNSSFTYKIVERQFIEIDGNIAPHNGETILRHQENDVVPSLTLDKNIYSQNQFYPSVNVSHNSTKTYRGVSLASVRVNPVQVNPQSKKIRITTRLKLKVTFSGGVKSSLTDIVSENQNRILKRRALNYQDYFGTTFRETMYNDWADDVLIVTINDFKEAAKRLAYWQRLKGLDVKIVTQSSWSADEVKKTCHDFYKNTSPKPSFVIIIGDSEHVPGVYDVSAWGDDFVTDYRYINLEENFTDYYPEMSKGRISVKDPEQAIQVVDKITSYESHPPRQMEDYYQNLVSCSYFQDHKADDTCDTDFISAMEAVNVHMEKQDYYRISRIYYADDEVNPKNFGTRGVFANQELPAFLQRPQMSWNGNADDIIHAFHRASSFIYHYDHGYHKGWGDPNFTLKHLDELQNNGYYPIVYSNNCKSGYFDHEEVCFTEKLLRLPNAGAAGVIAATRNGLTGFSDFMMRGYFDAAWPGLFPDQPQEPIFTIGDIMTHSYICLSAEGKYTDKYDKSYFELIHYFGDPTATIWTRIAQGITVKHNDAVNYKSTMNFYNLNTKSGMITLYNSRNDKIVGRSEIKGSSVKCELKKNDIQVGDSLLVTITSHNFFPYQKKVYVTDQTDIVNVNTVNNHFTVTLNGHSFKYETGRQLQMNIYSVNGKLLYSNKWDKIQKNLSVNLPHLSAGRYIVRLKNSVNSKQFSFIQK